MFDFIFRGMSQPLLGNFSIPLAKYIKKSKEKLNKQLQELNILAMEAQSPTKERTSSTSSECSFDSDILDYSSSQRANPKKSFLRMLTTHNTIVSVEEDNPSLEEDNPRLKVDDDNVSPKDFIKYPEYQNVKGELPKEINKPPS